MWARLSYIKKSVLSGIPAARSYLSRNQLFSYRCWLCGLGILYECGIIVHFR